MNQNNNKTIRIAIDAMGGDFAPKSEVEGAILAYKNKPKDWDIELILVGDEKKIKNRVRANRNGGDEVFNRSRRRSDYYERRPCCCF